MLYLFFCIFCTVLLMLCFKYFSIYQVPTFQAIVINYITCTLIGIYRLWPLPPLAQVVQASWWPFCLVLGFLFVLTFYLIALTAQRVGVTAASVASKISLIIPVLVSLLVLQNSLKTYTGLNYLGMGIALVAVVLASLPHNTGEKTKDKVALGSLALPFLIFLFSGIGDSLINYTNHFYLKPHEANYFTTFTFATSATSGTLVLLYLVLFRNIKWQWRSLISGVLLGIPNYFSIYFLLKTLSAFHNDGAFLYPVINIGIILMGMLAAIVLFKERLSRLNVAGVAAAIVALLLLSYQEIYSLFVVR